MKNLISFSVLSAQADEALIMSRSAGTLTRVGSFTLLVLMSSSVTRVDV